MKIKLGGNYMKIKCRVIGLCNNKGGVGKTSSAINLAASLVADGYKVLVIDADPQASLTVGMGVFEEDINYNLFTLLNNIICDEEILYDDVILNQEGFDLIPGSIELCALEVQLINEMRREFLLKTIVDELRYKYDFIIIDSAPSLSLLNVNVLVAVDSIIIPFSMNLYSVKGFEQLCQSIRLVKKKKLNQELVIKGILFTMVQDRLKITRKIKTMFQSVYGDEVNIFHTTIPSSVKVSEAAMEGKSIVTLFPKNAVAIAYRNLAQELIVHENKIIGA